MGSHNVVAEYEFLKKILYVVIPFGVAVMILLVIADLIHSPSAQSIITKTIITNAPIMGVYLNRFVSVCDSSIFYVFYYEES
jgi:hypothetical protein